MTRVVTYTTKAEFGAISSADEKLIAEILEVIRGIDNIELIEGSKSTDLQRSALHFSIGGDGTALSAIRKLANARSNAELVPLNVGTLGFISLPLNQLVESLEKPASYIPLLNISAANLTTPSLGIAANDVLFTRPNAKLLNFKVFVNDMVAFETRADGCLISTPIGSTAYSLSAGGPVVMHDAGVYIIQAICPLGLSLRPIIVPYTAVIRVEMTTPCELIIDGQQVDTDQMSFTVSSHFRHVAMKKLDFFNAIRTKLGWNIIPENTDRLALKQ